MNPLEILTKAMEVGVTIELRGEGLLVGPEQRLKPEFLALVRDHKAALIGWLSRPGVKGWRAVPPDELPLVPERPTPTASDRHRVVAFMVRQTGTGTGPMCRWLVERENAYFDGPGRGWDCAIICFAAARDAACWQLNRAEAETLELLEGFEAAASVKGRK